MSSTTPDNEKPKVSARRHLRPEEAAKLIAAAGKRGRYPERDKLLLRLAYRHGLRASEAVGLRWDAFDLDGGSLTIGRAKGGRTSTHTVARDDLSALRKMRKTTNGHGFLRLSVVVRFPLMRCNTSSVRRA
jgi:integrase